MNPGYHGSPDVRPRMNLSRPYASTPENGKIALDPTLFALWEYRCGHELNETIEFFRTQNFDALRLRVALFCLLQAKLLSDANKTATLSKPTLSIDESVSVIIVTHNSLTWLEELFDSLRGQTVSRLEIIVVDNASGDGTAQWLIQNYPQVKFVHLRQATSLAHAINQGIAAASGKYLLILNPDVRLEPDAIAQMVHVAQSDPTCAAVAAKLKFMWAPAFLNGIGNHVGGHAFGADNGLGHLDLGQFDSWDTVSSACFAAALVSRSAWENIGKLDDGFPLYYEDNEWCYRARLMGYTIRAAPRAVVYHAFSGRVPDGTETGMSPSKLQNVVYGRLRFAIKLLTPLYLLRFLSEYILEDMVGFVFALFRLNGQVIRAYWNAWRDSIKNLPTLLNQRKRIQHQRERSDRELFSWQRQVPPPLVWRGLPELTWDLVEHYYLPLIRSGKTRVLPEFADVQLDKIKIRSNAWSRARSIWRHEGGRSLARRIAKYIQWRLRQV